MKDELPDLPNKNNGVIFNGQGHSVQINGSGVCVAPKGRFKHQSFIYKGNIFVHGGTTIPSSDFNDDPLDLYCLDLEKEGERRWQKIKTKYANNSKQVQTVSAHAGVITGNKWYIFGGSNNDCKPNGQLLRLNLDTYEWSKLDQKGDVPTPRQSAFLTFYEKNWLLLYGGLSTSEVQIYNTFYFYNLDTKNWSKCDGTYIYQVYARLDPAICRFNDHLYMFGGTYRNMKSEQKYLDDFYEITVTTPGRNQSGKISMKRLISPFIPQSRSGHNLIGINEQYLILIGGENTNSTLKEGNSRNDDVNLIQNMWIYSIKYCSWNKLELNSINFKFRSMASCTNHHDKIYLFGGIYNYNYVLNDLVEITLDFEALNSIRKANNPCIKCHENKEYNIQPKSYPISIIEDITQNIEFPFSAFGLIVDNAMTNGATFLRITYNQHSGSQRIKLLKFEDDARLLWTEQELIGSLLNFNAGQMYIASGMDKKIKASILKDNLRRQYGYNIKIASLCLGQSFIFLSYNEETLTYRISLFQKEKIGVNQRYVFYYYAYNMAEKKVTSPQMQKIKTIITSKYGQYIDNIIYQRKSRNSLLIFNPKIQDSRKICQQQQQLQLKGEFESNNILYGSFEKIKELQRSGFNIYQCVDVSLRAYITCLYLKNDSMKITLSVKEISNHPTEIQTQVFLQKVDRLCKHKHVLQINSAFEFDLKITEIYYLYDIKKKLSFFNNGLLIYHKNRLITRFKYPLGELIIKKYYKLVQNHNFIRLFGFIQLPDHIPINIFKTNYLHHVMMEKLYSRLKFISKMFKKELINIAKDPQYKRAAPIKPNQDEIQQDKMEVVQVKATPTKDRSRRSEPIQRQISLRKRKGPSVSFQTAHLQRQIRHLLKEPNKFQELLKIIENNKKNYFNNDTPFYSSKVKPLSSRSVVKDIQISKKQEKNETSKDQMKQQNGIQQKNGFRIESQNIQSEMNPHQAKMWQLKEQMYRIVQRINQKQQASKVSENHSKNQEIKQLSQDANEMNVENNGSFEQERQFQQNLQKEEEQMDQEQIDQQKESVQDEQNGNGNQMIVEEVNSLNNGEQSVNQIQSNS